MKIPASPLLFVMLILTFLLLSCNMNHRTGHETEMWDVFEAQFEGPKDGNPFKDVELKAIFSMNGTEQEITGFYDGDGSYKIRFMPDKLGEWSYSTKSNVAVLNGKTGTFKCIPPSENNHGPVAVYNTYHFRYADGTPYKQIGTTCYA